MDPNETKKVRKKRRTPPRGLDLGTGEQLERRSDRTDGSIQLPLFNGVEEVHPPYLVQDSRANVRGSSEHVTSDGLSAGSVGSDQDPGRHTSSSGLEPDQPGGQELDVVAALGTSVEHESSSSILPDRHQDETEVRGSGRESEPLRNELSSLDAEDALPVQRPVFADGVTGLTTEDCIHAMKLLARFMDVCNVLSDYPNADMEEIRQCMDAFDVQVDETVTYYYQTLDTLEQLGG